MTYETPTGANMFAYCMNNPVMGVDPDGDWSTAAIAAGAVGAALCLAAFTVLTAGVGTASLVGAVAVGAAKGTLIGAGAGAAIGAIAGGITEKSIDGVISGAAMGLGAGAAIGAVAGSVAGGVNFAKTHGLVIKKIGRLEATNHPNDPQLGVKYQINKPNGRPTTRSIEFHYNHEHKGYKLHWQQNSWNPRNNSVSSMKHWTLLGRRI